MAAKMLGIQQPAIFRFKFGGLEITNICDGKALRDGLHPKFGEERPAAEARALAEANRIDADKFEHPFTPTLVNTGKELILFDTGNGAARRGTGVGNLGTLLPAAGYAPEDVDIVVLTHGHPDHIGGLMEDGKPAFPNARYVFGATEFDFWKRGENIREARKANREMFMKLAVPLADRATFIKPGDTVASGIHAVDGAGHSPGLMAFHIESEGKRLMLWADVAIHYVVALQRPEWTVDVDDDKDKAVATRKRILDMVATDRLWAIGFHMPFPGIGFVERYEANYRWVPASYQMNL